MTRKKAAKKTEAAAEDKPAIQPKAEKAEKAPVEPRRAAAAEAPAEEPAAEAPAEEPAAEAPADEPAAEAADRQGLRTMLAEALEHLVRGVVDHPDDVTRADKQLRRGSILEVRVQPRPTSAR